MLGNIATEAQPVAVLFHEEDSSTASGLRFGRVEVLLTDSGREQYGLLPRIGAEAMARELAVPLILDEDPLD
jgi:hypothetical protein